MKTKVVFLLCMILSVIVFGQNEKQKILFETKVVPPKFPVIKTTIQGKSIESINDYLGSYVQYPDKALNSSSEGTEVIQFVVTPSGELISFNVINSVSSDFDHEVIRVLKLTNGNWKPGTVDGEPVAMIKEVSLVFKLLKNTNFVSMAKKYSAKGGKMLFVEKNPKKAIRYFDMGITLLPNEESLLTMRGICKFELGDENGARSDWNRIRNLSDSDKNQLEPVYLADDIRKFKGYSEMMQITQK